MRQLAGLAGEARPIRGFVHCNVGQKAYVSAMVLIKDRKMWNAIDSFKSIIGLKLE